MITINYVLQMIIKVNIFDNDYHFQKPQLSLYFSLLLVINKHMKLENILNHDLTTLADKNKERFIANEPFSHILLENFLKKIISERF